MKQDHNDLRNLTDNANSRQVGGDHYKTGNVEHWDLFGPDYLMGYATKYMRWRKKGGTQDLEKAIHVIEKLKEVTTEANLPSYRVSDVESWCEAAGLDWVERTIVRRILHMRGRGDLDDAIAGIRHLIEQHGRMPTVREQLERSIERRVIVTNNDGTIQREFKIDDQNNYVESDRRVPRYDPSEFQITRKIPSFHFEDIVPRRAVQEAVRDHASMMQRTPEDGAQHASLYPWVITREQIREELGSTDLFGMFYQQRGEIFVLEPHVAAHNLPRGLVHCYLLASGGGWTLDVRRCPPDARECFPDLRPEKNIKELEELPSWQQGLYEWNVEGNKYVLTERHRAWHREDE
jgi:hypothetical protein